MSTLNLATKGYVDAQLNTKADQSEIDSLNGEIADIRADVRVKLEAEDIDTTVPADPDEASDEKVPSTKSVSTLAVLLETALNGKVNTSAIQTSLSGDPDTEDNAHVPSAKAVSEAIQNEVVNINDTTAALSGALDDKFDKENIKTSWDMSEDDDHVPSAALVKALADAAEVTTNKVTDLSTEPGDGKYPDAKAVYTALSGKLDASDADDTYATKTRAEEIYTLASNASTNADYASTLANTNDDRITVLEGGMSGKQDKLTIDNTTKLIAVLENGTTVTLNVVTIAE